MPPLAEQKRIVAKLEESLPLFDRLIQLGGITQMKVIYDICYGSCTAQSLDLYLPETDAFPVFVYFHGGGLDHGDKSSPQTVFRTLAQMGIAVVTANYRMYPEAKYPEFLQDAACAVSWVKQFIETYGSIKGIYVGGSSAGGYISQMLCFDTSYYAAYGVQPTDIAGYIHDAGQPTCHFSVVQERGLDARRIVVDESAPLYHIEADKTYPPMLIFVSDDDIPNRYEQTMLLCSTLRCFGYSEKTELKVMHGKHCAYSRDSDCAAFCEMIKDFIFQ